MTNPQLTVTVQGQPVTFTSAFTTAADAASFLRDRQPNDFVRSLLARRNWTPSQAAWLHKIATDMIERVASPVCAASAVDLTPIVALMDLAFQAQKRFPRLTLQNGSELLLLQRLGSRSSCPGGVSVTGEGKRWFGTITPEGTVRKGRLWDTVRERIEELAGNPAKVAGQNGIATGQCCFCRKLLSTRESRSVGYGPECAVKHGLPWGETTAADEANAKALREAERDRRDEEYSAMCESDEAVRSEQR